MNEHFCRFSNTIKKIERIKVDYHIKLIFLFRLINQPLVSESESNLTICEFTFFLTILYVINSNKYFETEKIQAIQFWQETRIDNSLNSHLKWYFPHIEKTYIFYKSIHELLAKINIWKFSNLENLESQISAAG